MLTTIARKARATIRRRRLARELGVDAAVLDEALRALTDLHS